MFEKLKNLFIPCVENGYKPNFLERMSVGIMLVLVVLSFTVANIQALLWISSDWMVSTILPAVIVDLTNEERGQEKLGSLTRSDVLDEAAQLKANDMAKYEYFAHYSPTGVSPWYWFDQVSYDYVNAGENLAVHFTDSSDVVEAWMDSPSHRANIMNGNYTEIGVGTAKGEYKGFPTIFVVQLFGTPNILKKQAVTEVAGANVAPTTVPDTGISLESITVQDTNDASTTESVAPATIETNAGEAKVETSTAPEVIESTEQEAPPANVTVVNPPTLSETVVLYSDMATTSREGVPAVMNQDTDTHSKYSTNAFARSVTQSSSFLQIIYEILALIVVIALILSIVIEWRRQNPVQIAYAGGLLTVMAFLFYIHTALTSGVTII